MRLGIFGDSFSCEEVMNKKCLGHPNLPKIGNSWVTYLREYYDITNYSVMGCDPFYMYEKFLRYHHAHDIIIFVFPRPGRISTSFEGKEIHIANERIVGDEPVYPAYADWHKYLFNEKKETHHALQIKREMLEIRPDVKFMYGATWDHSDRNNSLINISHLENESWGEDTASVTKKYMDLRYSHFTKTNNIILYRKTLNCLSKNQEIRIDKSDFVKPSKEEKKCYLISK